jgi:hypothetical protein
LSLNVINVYFDIPEVWLAEKHQPMDGCLLKHRTCWNKRATVRAARRAS